MDFIFTERFKKSYKKLPKDEQKALHKKLSLMGRNPHHPSLRTKKVRGTNDIFECSVSMSIRMTWKHDSESIVLRVVGKHDEVLKNP
jgi:mRNA-degrading endonuclease RelE of RelBE toxin-antitoxin system